MNYVDVGMMESTGTLECDVMVPTKLSGVRHRDSPQSNDGKLDAECNRFDK